MAAPLAQSSISEEPGISQYNSAAACLSPTGFAPSPLDVGRAGRIYRPAERRRAEPGRADPLGPGPRQGQPERIRRRLGRVPARLRLHRLRLHVGADGARCAGQEKGRTSSTPASSAPRAFYFARLLPRIHSLIVSVKAAVPGGRRAVLRAIPRASGACLGTRMPHLTNVRSPAPSCLLWQLRSEANFEL